MVVYLLLINALGFTIMYLDKQFARKKKWRISERTLFLTALLGGSAGVFFAIGFFRHKTKHRSFTLGVPLILISQLFVSFWFFR